MDYRRTALIGLDPAVSAGGGGSSAIKDDARFAIDFTGSGNQREITAGLGICGRDDEARHTFRKGAVHRARAILPGDHQTDGGAILHGLPVNDHMNFVAGRRIQRRVNREEVKRIRRCSGTGAGGKEYSANKPDGSRAEPACCDTTERDPGRCNRFPLIDFDMVVSFRCLKPPSSYIYG